MRLINDDFAEAARKRARKLRGKSGIGESNDGQIPRVIKIKFSSFTAPGLHLLCARLISLQLPLSFLVYIEAAAKLVIVGAGFTLMVAVAVAAIPLELVTVRV